jgi:hypothetical protein
MFRASFLFMPIFPTGVVLHISYIVYHGFASASFTTGGCVSAPISSVPSACLAVSQLLVTREFQNDMLLYLHFRCTQYTHFTWKFKHPSAPNLIVTRLVFLHDMFGAGGSGSSHTGSSQVSFFCVIFHILDLEYLIQKERIYFITFIGTFYQNIVGEGARLFKQIISCYWIVTVVIVSQLRALAMLLLLEVGELTRTTLMCPAVA